MQMCLCWLLPAGFMSRLDYSVCSVQNVWSDTLMSKAYTCLLRSVCPHKLLWLTEKHLCVCVCVCYLGDKGIQIVGIRSAGEASVREVQMGLQCENGSKKPDNQHIPLARGFWAEISPSVGGRGQAVHKQRQGGFTVRAVVCDHRYRRGERSGSPRLSKCSDMLTMEKFRVKKWSPFTRISVKTTKVKFAARPLWR